MDPSLSHLISWAEPTRGDAPLPLTVCASPTQCQITGATELSVTDMTGTSFDTLTAQCPSCPDCLPLRRQVCPEPQALSGDVGFRLGVESMGEGRCR